MLCNNRVNPSIANQVLKIWAYFLKNIRSIYGQLLLLHSIYISRVGLIDTFDTIDLLRNTPHNEIKILADILEKYGHDTIKRIERENYLERFARTIGSASLISSCVLIFSFIMYYRFGDLIISLILVVITIVCLKENKRWIKKLRENIVHLDIGVGPPPLLADR